MVRYIVAIRDVSRSRDYPSLPQGCLEASAMEWSVREQGSASPNYKISDWILSDLHLVAHSILSPSDTSSSFSSVRSAHICGTVFTPKSQIYGLVGLETAMHLRTCSSRNQLYSEANHMNWILFLY